MLIKVLDVSRRGYHAWSTEQRDRRRARDEELTAFARLMKRANLCGRQQRAYRPQTTCSDHDGPIAPNRLAQIESITACDQVWQTDITYLPPRTGWLYLVVVIDAYGRRVLGWAFSSSLETDVVICALAVTFLLPTQTQSVGIDLLVRSKPHRSSRALLFGSQQNVSILQWVMSSGVSIIKIHFCRSIFKTYPRWRRLL